MRLERVKVGGFWRFVSTDYVLLSLKTHDENPGCIEHNCVVHNPSDNVMSSFPYNWRGGRGIMERICPHGIGHPDIDAAAFMSRQGKSNENMHGCDGCCG